MKIAAAAMFTVLCVIGITTINDPDKIEEMQVAARQVITDLTQQKIPDAGDDTALTVNGSAYSAGSDDTALTDGTTHTTGFGDGSAAGTATNGTGITGTTVAATGGNTATANDNATATNATGTSGATTGNSADGMPWSDVTPPDAFPTGTTTETTGTTQTATQPTSYTIMRGDTLNAICRRKYGDLGMVKQVCELNGIKNPNNIEVGQTILLP